MRPLLCAAALLSTALLGAGCKPGPSLVGKWTGKMNNVPGTFDFKPDGKFTTTATNGGVTMTITGDYTVSGDQATMTLKDLQIPGQTPALAQAARNQMQSIFDKPQVNTLAFASADQVSLTDKAATGNNATMTLTRVKEGS